MPRRPLSRAVLLRWVISLCLILVLCLVLAAANGAGRVDLPGLLGLGSESLGEEERSVMTRILLQVRLPRVLLAGLLGAALTVAGIAFQALLRNPLADPFVLGVSGGASLGGVLALLLGLGAGSVGRWVGVPGFAFLGALGSLVLIERVATIGGRFTVHTILLTGVIFNAFAAALIYFVQSIATLEELHAIVFYLMGQVPVGYGYPAIAGIALFVLVVSGLLLLKARAFNTLSLGEEGAAQLGVDVDRLRLHTFVLGSLLTGMAVSLAGLIGFVGLVVPHLLRLLFGPDHRLLIPAGLIGGAAFLVLADLVARVLVPPNEIPVGVVTALVGGPFFLMLLRSRGARYEFG
ncbi:FecCD family ABC transporter permease [Gemmatimonadota bacterium]